LFRYYDKAIYGWAPERRSTVRRSAVENAWPARAVSGSLRTLVFAKWVAPGDDLW